MDVKELLDYFRKIPQDFPLGYMYLELKETKKIDIHSSISRLHNSERFLGGIIHKELSSAHKYKK
ncbi:MAG: hypothetical protein AB7E36_10860 [Salinivirgaceae bacterium]